MPEFAYTARNMEGRDLSGVLQAATKRDAFALLAQKSLFPLKVEDTEKRSPLAFLTAKRVRTDVLCDQLSQLADLLDNGVPLLASLELLADQSEQPAMAEILRDVRDQVADGVSLESALARHPNAFSELTVSMVRAGSEGGFLEESLKRISLFLKRQQELIARVKNALAYPAFLAVGGFIATAVLVVFFVPRFEPLFNRLMKQGMGLPVATQVLLAISDFLRDYWMICIAIVIGLLVGIKQLCSTERARDFIDKWKLKIPVVGPIFHNTAVSRFCRVLGTLLRNGVPILRALEISSASSGNRLLSATIRNSAENIASGQTLSQPLSESGLIPKQIMAMLRVAEESNKLDEVLVNISDTIDGKIEQQLSIMVRLIEPIMLVLIGGVVLFILLALLMPVIDLSTAV